MKKIIISLIVILFNCNIYAEEIKPVYSDGNKKLYISAFKYSPFDNEKIPRICFTYEENGITEQVIIGFKDLRKLQTLN